MGNIKLIPLVFAATVAAAVLTLPNVSYAGWWGRHRNHYEAPRHEYRYHERPRFGLRVSFLPSRYISLSVGNVRFYYDDGLYYRRIGSEYVLVTPPVGAVVRTIPVDFTPVLVNGVTYYADAGVYYQYTPQGYQVVPAPLVPAVVPVPVVAAPAVEPEGPYTVNIPNTDGGYTSVIIKKSGDGFIGPQGEFYPEFPRVEQLRVMYGR